MMEIIARVVASISGVAVAIAGLGLFGMAAYVSSLRRHEVGIRKSQGASTKQLLRQFLWEFAKPIVVANVVAWPIAYVAAQAYVGVFMHPAPITVLPFAMSLLLTLLVAGVAVGGHVLRTARLNPARALRH